jgi:GNAT superfamily N-acetyltransferase
MVTLIDRLTKVLKEISGFVSDGAFLSGHPELAEMNLDRDFPEIDRLFVQEEWPFLRTDLEASHAQPRATALVARKEGRFAGFFAAHAFGDVGYLDMMIIDASFRGKGVARPLYFRTVKELRRKGIRSFVVHTTNDSARLIRLIGFRPGQSFTLLSRDPVASTPGEDLPKLGEADRDDLVRLDAAVFGLARPTWIGALLAQSSTRFYGLRKDGTLAASVCLRARKNGAVCLDLANGAAFEPLGALIDAVLARNGGQRIECFARTGSELHRRLEERGFTVLEFFKPIGPLVEWRKGPTGDAGASPRVQCLAWF